MSGRKIIFSPSSRLWADKILINSRKTNSLITHIPSVGLPWWLIGKELANYCRRPETQVPFLCQEDLLEKEITTHFSILAWRIPWTGAWQTTVHEAAKSRTRLCDFHFQKIRERNI